MSAVIEAEALDLRHGDAVRAVNARLQGRDGPVEGRRFRLVDPGGAHAVAAGLTDPMTVEIDGHVGYYCAGMNKAADVIVRGNAGVGAAENIMSGSVRVTGNASQSAGATGRGGLLVIDGDASSRCGVSMKGVDIVVGGSVGHNSAFMAQAGRLVICGDADDGLGDSIYEARIYLRGTAHGLGADCVEKEMRAEHEAELADLLTRAGLDHPVSDFRRYGSARTLYTFKIDNLGAY